MIIDSRSDRVSFQDLGVTGLTESRSLARKNELIEVVRSTISEIKEGSGQIIVEDLITDRQKRHAVVFLNRSGLRGRVQIDRGFPYHDGQRLTSGTRILVYPSDSRRGD